MPRVVHHGLAPLVAHRLPAVEIDVQDRRALLALPDVPAGFLDLAVAAPARVGVPALERVHGEVHGVAAAVAAPTAEVVRQDALARLPRLPILEPCK